MNTIQSKFKSQAANEYDNIIIAGGGLAAIFAGYEILKQAKQAGKDLNVVILADKINAPCTAGSHVVLEMEGMYMQPRHERSERIPEMLRSALTSLVETVNSEKINCRLNMEYEVKAQTQTELDDVLKAFIENGVYRPDDFTVNSDKQSFNLPGHPCSAYTNKIGQINTPEMVHGFIEAFKAMGGQFKEGVQYQGQHKTADGKYIVNTSQGDFISRSKPLLATGAEHQKSLPEFPFKADAVYTMGLVIGPLNAEDRTRISNKPMAMCNTALDSDVLWGGLDEKGYFTLGMGDLTNPTQEEYDHLLQHLTDLVENMYPGLTKKYTAQVSFGAMLCAENRMPIVGRMKDYDLSGGWAGMGIVPGFAAAKAYADWVVHGNDADLKIFESLQPGKFSGATAQCTETMHPQPHKQP